MQEYLNGMWRQKMKITIKIWILILFVIFSLVSIFSIPPLFMQDGVLVSSVDRNSSLFQEGLRSGMIIEYINQERISSLEQYSEVVDFQGEQRVDIITKEGLEIIGLFTPEDFQQLTVRKIPSTRIRTGLDLQGGARALVSPVEPVTETQMDDLIAISQERFNAFGLTDVQIRKVSDLTGNQFMLIEVAGSTPEDLQEIISQQGNFEARIANQTVFRGGDRDVTYVGRTGQDAAVVECFVVEGGESCRFRFTIYLSSIAAQRHADITSELDIITLNGGRYLSEQIDFYLDGNLIDSLNIAAELRGRSTTQIQISGSGFGPTRQEAINDARQNMNTLQTVLITGSLPFELRIDKIDRISPRLGQEFTRQLFLGGLFAFIAVGLVVFVRYRKIKYVAAQLIALFSEVVIILGLAALIRWNLDLPSIAGIIAAIGTGMDSQIVILDESRSDEGSLKQRIKKALFIIITAFTTTFFALIPLTGALGFMGIGAVSAGLLQGFAITTLIGISVGVFISRPAFADMIRQMGDN